MAETKAKEAPKKETAVAPTNGQGLSINGVVMTSEQVAEALQSAEVGDKDSNYLDIEPGEERRAIYLGIEPIDGMGDKVGTKVPACKFAVLTDEGKTREQINADAVIVSYFEKQQPGIARRIVCTGIQRSKSGFDYKKFEFYPLKFKK